MTAATTTTSAAVEDDDHATRWDWQTSDTAPPDGTPLEYVAAYYCRHGLAVVPLVGKNPGRYGPDWWTRAITDPTEALKVFSDSTYTNVGWAQGYGTVAVDVDHPDKLTDEVRDVIRRGALNLTRPNRGHRVFATDTPLSGRTSGFPVEGWGEVRGVGGQVVIWGPHPTAQGEHYRYDPRQVVPPAPAQLLEWLLPRGSYEAAATPAEVDEFIATHTTETTAKLASVPVDRAEDARAGGRSLHMTAVALACELFRDARAGIYSARTAVDALEQWWTTAWTERARRPANSNGELLRTHPRPDELAGVMAWAVAQAVAEPDDEIGQRRERVARRPEPTPPDSGPEDDPHRLLRLPGEFWDERLVLAHIRQAALSRMAPPDAVLAAVLARVAALTSHTVELPPNVGSAVGLSYLVGLVGPPQAGKSSAVAAARDLIPRPVNHTIADSLPLGSGEGVAEIMFDTVTRTDDNGKKQRVREQVRHSALFIVDEGTLLAELAARKGTTTMSTLRTAYTHGVLGAANASADRRRLLSGDDYVIGVIVNLQPDLAGPLFDAASIGAGSPQRFHWVWCIDPTLDPDPCPWPGPLDWSPPGPGRVAPLRHVEAGRKVRHRLPVPTAITEEIRRGIHRDRTAEDADPLDAHRHLGRLKAAALLAILDDRLEVTDDDWRLAGTVTTTSRTVQRFVAAHLKAAEARAEMARIDRGIRREEASEDAAVARAFRSSVNTAARKVHRDGSASRRDLSRSVAGKYRDLGVDIDEVIAQAERDGYIRADGDRWVPGRCKP